MGGKREGGCEGLGGANVVGKAGGMVEAGWGEAGGMRGAKHKKRE